MGLALSFRGLQIKFWRNLAVIWGFIRVFFKVRAHICVFHLKLLLILFLIFLKLIIGQILEKLKALLPHIFLLQFMKEFEMLMIFHLLLASLQIRFFFKVHSLLLHVNYYEIGDIRMFLLIYFVIFNPICRAWCSLLCLRFCKIYSRLIMAFIFQIFYYFS